MPRQLREQWFFYDAQPYGVLNRGNPTRTESWLDQVTASLTNPCTAAPAQRCTRTDSEYDTAGNVTATVDPLRNRIEITYDPETRIYPYITTAVQFQHRVATRFDPGCATLVWQSVPYTGNAGPEAASVAKEQQRYDADVHHLLGDGHRIGGELHRHSQRVQLAHSCDHRRKHIHRQASQRAPGLDSRFHSALIRNPMAGTFES
jgi:hypothetical protein